MARLPADPDQVRMPFSEHLEELRKRLMRAVIVLFALFMGGWMFFSDVLQRVVMRPHLRAAGALRAMDPPIDVSDQLHVLTYTESIFFEIKVALIVAAVLGFPYVVYEIWQFVAAGLYPKERKTIMKYVPVSVSFSAVGVLFGYFFMIPEVLTFLATLMNPDLVVASFRLSEYFSLFLMFTIALAAIFQLPLILLGLSAAGIVDYPTLKKYRRHFILGAFLFSAIFTPPEPYSQLLMAIPTVLLFELGVLMVRLRERKPAAVAA